jgi:hypothetical protein
MTTMTWLMAVLLADDLPHNTGPDFGKASPFGLLILVLLLIGTFGLVWSMNRHLNKLPESFEGDGDEADGAADDDAADPTSPTGEPGAQPPG